MIKTTALGAILVAITACGGGASDDDAATSSPATSSTTTLPTVNTDGSVLYGEFTLHDSKNSVGGLNDCHGDRSSGYDDVGPGMNVTVRDGDGSIIGTGQTRNLLAHESPPFDDTLAEAKRMTQYCTLVFAVDLAEDADFYSIAVGHRGELSYSRAELAAQKWYVALELR